MTEERRNPGMLGRRANDHADGQVEWLERHFSSVIRGEFESLKMDLANTVEMILKTTVGGLLVVHERKHHGVWGDVRLVLACVAASMTSVGCLLFVGKVAGWWL